MCVIIKATLCWGIAMNNFRMTYQVTGKGLRSVVRKFEDNLVKSRKRVVCVNVFLMRVIDGNKTEFAYVVDFVCVCYSL